LLPQLLRPELKLDDRDKDNVRRFIEQNAQKETIQEKSSRGGRFRARTRLRLGAAYANPNLMRSYVFAESQGKPMSREEEIDVIRNEVMHSSTNSDVHGFLESSGNLSASGGKIRLAGKNPRNGEFVFEFAVDRDPSSAIRLRLNSMEIREDASAGSTRWRFYFLPGR